MTCKYFNRINPLKGGFSFFREEMRSVKVVLTAKAFLKSDLYF